LKYKLKAGGSFAKKKRRIIIGQHDYI